MLQRVLYLVRHGEVANTNHVVYGNMHGFHLSPLGVLQAHGCALYLAGRELDIVVSSPLERARETATAIARHHDSSPVVDERLTESGQFPHWTGNSWDEVPKLFPGELEAYLDDPSSLRSQESLADVGKRVVSVVESNMIAGQLRLVLVGHQDPIQAARLMLLRRSLSELRVDPPSHAEVITLTTDGEGSWQQSARWSPSSGID